MFAFGFKAPVSSFLWWWSFSLITRCTGQFLFCELVLNVSILKLSLEPAQSTFTILQRSVRSNISVSSRTTSKESGGVTKDQEPVLTHQTHKQNHIKAIIHTCDSRQTGALSLLLLWIQSFQRPADGVGRWLLATSRASLETWETRTPASRHAAGLSTQGKKKIRLCRWSCHPMAAPPPPQPAWIHQKQAWVELSRQEITYVR